ncbi:M16 family metallopeptidase [Ferrimonas senticii]|uniref:M16 family metallopeptidase n=1 Tax=Ferrimonas senticii TaxID=394566 RepID=UPI0004251DB5|nr:pitrilysin family protein [Ferrimonas senticii]
MTAVINRTKTLLALTVSVALSGCAITESGSESAAKSTQNAGNAGNAAQSVKPFVMPKMATSGAKFQLPSYQQYQLANGLTVYLLQRDKVPLVTAELWMPVGAVNDSDAGIAMLTSQGLLLGTDKLSKAQLEQQVEQLGASLTARADKEATVIASQFQSKDITTMLALLADVAINPSFPAAEVVKARDRYVAQLAQQKESPRAVIGNYFDRLVYGNHPYGNAAAGNADELSQLDEFDLKLFHGSWYQPRGSALVISGDFANEKASQLVQGYFGGWDDRATPQAPDLAAAIAPANGAKVLLVDKPDARETTFMIGGIGVARDNPDYVGLMVVNTILGGRFTSWLNDELRVKAGLTYGARSRFAALSEHGSFYLSSFTASKNTKAAVDLALSTYQRLWQQGIDQATLDSAKAYVKGQFPPKYETAEQLAGLLGQSHLMGLSTKQPNRFSEQVDSLTLTEVQRLVAEHFPQQNLQFVLVGNAAEIAAIAGEYGEVTQVEINQSGFRF